MMLPDHPEKFTTDWLAQKLGSASLGATKGDLESFTFSPIGTGQVGDSYRLILNWRSGAGAALPQTVVAKCPAADEKSRQTGVQLRNYALEVGWYKNYAHKAKVRTPLCYYTEIDDDLTHFVLLMEDLAPAEPGNQLAGADAAQVALILAEVAHLHGFKWNDKSLSAVAWLNYSKSDETRAFIQNFVPQVYPEWVERYRGRIDETILEMGADFVSRLPAYQTPDPAAPLTITHGDVRLDNVLFKDRAGRAVLVDWQTVSSGAPMADVAYCLTTSFADPAARAACEEKLVADYLTQLGNYNKNSYAFDQAWLDYRRAAFGGFFMGVIAAMLVERTERGDEMFAVMAERSGAAAIHLDSLSLL